ncbi:MAG: GNAT family N-acetyltransferase [Acidimicrobiales bacterium]
MPIAPLRTAGLTLRTVRPDDLDAARLELGYVVHADHWGRGYATVAGTAAVEATQRAGVEVFGTIRPIACRRRPDRPGAPREPEHHLQGLPRR